MSKSTVLLFRILLVVGGFLLTYIIGKPMVETIQYRMSGQRVEGKVIGFRGNKSSKTIFDDNTTKKGRKYRARRPVYRYPIAAGSLDSLDGYAHSTVLFPWLNFELNEKVQIVIDKDNPNHSRLFSVGVLCSDLTLILLSFYMIKLGIVRAKT